MAAKKPAKAKTPTAKRAAPRRPVPKKAAAKRAAKKAVTKGGARKAAARGPALASPRFGRPHKAGKAEGDAAVRAWIAGVKPEHRPIVARLDALIGEVVPDVKRAIKWSTPLYGREGIGYFASVASFKNHVGFLFFSGTSLKPVPPEGESKTMRRVNLHGMEDFDEPLFRSWLEQASRIPGWAKV